jgi:hypothetical protein
MTLANQEENNALGEFYLDNQPRNQKTADEEENQLDFIHVFVFPGLRFSFYGAKCKLLWRIFIGVFPWQYIPILWVQAFIQIVFPGIIGEGINGSGEIRKDLYPVIKLPHSLRGGSLVRSAFSPISRK